MDISQKLLYVFKFYGDTILNDCPENIKKLTTLLCLNNRSVKKDVILICSGILSSEHVTSVAKETTISELALMKDILIAICHNEPVTVAVPTLKLISEYADMFAPEMSDKEKIFLLLVGPNPKVKELAKTFFLQQMSQPSNCGFIVNLLKTIEQLIISYQDAADHIDRIAEVMCDSLPSFIDIFLYIAKNNSRVISRFARIVISIIIKRNDNSPDDRDRLRTVAQLAKGTLKTAANVKNWDIFRDISEGLMDISDSILNEIPKTEWRDLGLYLMKTLLEEKDINGDHIEIITKLMIRMYNIADCDVDIDVIGERWNILESLARAYSNGTMQDKVASLNIQIDRKLQVAAEKPIELITAKHLLVISLVNREEIVTEIQALLTLIEENYLTQDIDSEHRFVSLLRIIIQLLLKFLPHLDTPAQLELFDRMSKRIFGLFETGTEKFGYLPDECQGHIEAFLEFSTIWADVEVVSRFLIGQAQVTKCKSSLNTILITLIL